MGASGNAETVLKAPRTIRADRLKPQEQALLKPWL